MPHETSSSSRAFGAFRFPYDKYADEIAIYENFRYLQEYLRGLGVGDKYPTTVIVASGTSHNRSSAHFKCDGTSDNIVIQDAIDALPSSGGEIVFLEGTYNLSDSITLPSSARIKLSGKGAVFNFAALKRLNRGSANHVVIEGMGFTNGNSANNNGFIITGEAESTLITGCDFFDIDCVFVINVGLGETIVTGNHFRDIDLNASGGGFVQGAIMGWQEPSSASGIFANNVCTNITKTTSAGFSAYVVYVEGGPDTVIATGNYIADSTGLDDYFGGVTIDAHNMVDNVMIGGDHTGVDHGSLSGLTDDDHTQYLKEKASGGLAAEVPEHDHSVSGEGSKTAFEELANAAGDIWYASAADTGARLAIGTAGQVLKVNSGATAPEWDDESAGSGGAAAFNEFLLIGA